MRARPLHVEDRARQRLGEVSAGHGHFPVVDVVALRDLAAPAALVMGGIVERNAEGREAAGRAVAGKRGDEARIDAAGKLDRIADVACQMRTDRCFDGVGSQRLGPGRIDRGVGPERIERIAEAPFGNPAVVKGDGKDRAARHTFDMFQIGEPPRRPVESEELRQRRRVGLRRNQTQERAHLARQSNEVAVACEIERLDTKGIAGGDQRILFAVQHDEGEHALEPIEHRLAPLGVAEQDGLAVAVGAEFGARILQRLPNRPIVIDLAIVDKRVAAAGIGHRLVGAGRGVENGETAEDERDAGFGKRAAGIRAAVMEVALHLGQERLRKTPAGFDDCGQTAH